MASVSVTLRNDLSEIQRLAGIVDAFAAEHGIPAEVTLRVNLALDEVITNIISYGYDDTHNHDIVARLTFNGHNVIVEVADDGRPFNPLEAAPVDFDVALEDRAIGGCGIHIVRSVMDAIEYRREEDRNVLVMRKAAHPSLP